MITRRVPGEQVSLLNITPRDYSHEVRTSRDSRSSVSVIGTVALSRFIFVCDTVVYSMLVEGSIFDIVRIFSIVIAALYLESPFCSVTLNCNRVLRHQHPT